jgi:CDP-2,3-bis-(O-geranylgeranyl)-sn-glycerol synthase
MMDFALACIRALYLFAPLLLSAALSGTVLRFDWAPWLAKPIDGSHRIAGQRIFGDGKTWRGVVVAVTGSVLGATIQKAVPADWVANVAVLDYAELNSAAFGAAMGAGATLGELPNSFLKRRLGIARGKTASGTLGIVFYLFDQLDLLLGAWPLIWPWVHPSFTLIAASIVITLALHPVVALVGYSVGARATAR